jgi:hypothetical protein
MATPSSPDVVVSVKPESKGESKRARRPAPLPMSMIEVKEPKRPATLIVGVVYGFADTWNAFRIPAKDKFALKGFETLWATAPALFSAMHPSEYSGWGLTELDKFIKTRSCDACEDREKSGGLSHWFGITKEGKSAVRFHCSAACASADLFNTELKAHPSPLDCVVESTRMGNYEKMSQIRGLLKNSLPVSDQQAIEHLFNAIVRAIAHPAE